MKKYIVEVISSCVVEAENKEEAREDVQLSINDSYNNCFGGVPDEIVANAVITKVKLDPDKD